MLALFTRLYKDARSTKHKKCDIKRFRNHQIMKGSLNSGKAARIKYILAEED